MILPKNIRVTKLLRHFSKDKLIKQIEHAKTAEPPKIKTRPSLAEAMKNALKRARHD